jgi:hypothetical protein
MKKTLYVPFRVILCPACCNFHADLNILFAAAYADEYVNEHNSHQTALEKRRQEYQCCTS